MALSDDTKLALAAAEEASKRARRTLLFIQIAAVITFIAIWQELRFTWLNRRLITAQKVEWALTCRPEAFYPIHPAGLNAQTKPEDTLRCANLPFHTVDTNKSPEYQRKELAGAQAKLENEVKGYLNEWGYSLEQVRTMVADLQRVVADRVLNVPIPLFGVSFDVNDLSVISGLSFVILLSWLKFSLWRLRDNVQEVFVRAAEHEPPELADAYDLLRMTQVFTVPEARRPIPRSTRDGQLRHRFLGPSNVISDNSSGNSLLAGVFKITNLIFWTGVAAQVSALVVDLRTAHYGMILSNRLAFSENMVALVLTLYVLFRAWQCQALVNAIAAEWSRALHAARLEPGQESFLRTMGDRRIRDRRIAS
jgi:hypothetical protein